MKKHHKSADGKYHIGDRKFEILIGSRAQVWHGTAYKTSGGLTKKDLHMNSNGRIVSKKKHQTAKAEKRLEKHGYYAQKGKFGFVKRTPRGSPKKSRSRSHTKSHRRAKTIGGTCRTKK